VDLGSPTAVVTGSWPGSTGRDVRTSALAARRQLGETVSNLPGSVPR
jgi:hypothetical protein